MRRTWPAGRRAASAAVLGLAISFGCSPTAVAQERDASSDASPAKLFESGGGDWTLRSLQLRWAPVFSPYVELRHVWTMQGSWFVATTEGAWSEPWPASRSTRILDAGERQAFFDDVQRVVRGAAIGDCTADGHTLSAGMMEIRGQLVGDGGVVERCLRVTSNDLAPPTLYVALAAHAPDVEAVDRWTHPFWLTTESGILRIELEGTADAFVGEESLGRVEGVVVVRLLPDAYALRFVAPDGTERREHTQIRREQVTVLRLRMQTSAAADGGTAGGGTAVQR